MYNSIKDFFGWIKKKESINIKNHKPPMVSEGDIWWCRVGLNIGTEIYGKSNKYSRPGIIYKKLSHSFYLVIPTTSKNKEGSWYCNFNFKEQNITACLHQIRVCRLQKII